MVNWYAVMLLALLAFVGCEPSTTMTQLDKEPFFQLAYQPLARAVRLGTLSVIDGQLKAGLDDVDHLRILLDHKGAPDREDRGEKALITAIMRLFKEPMYVLLDKGTDIDTRVPRPHDPAVSILDGEEWHYAA